MKQCLSFLFILFCLAGCSEKPKIKHTQKDYKFVYTGFDFNIGKNFVAIYENGESKRIFEDGKNCEEASLPKFTVDGKKIILRKNKHLTLHDLDSQVEKVLVNNKASSDFYLLNDNELIVLVNASILYKNGEREFKGEQSLILVNINTCEQTVLANWPRERFEVTNLALATNNEFAVLTWRDHDDLNKRGLIRFDLQAKKEKIIALNESIVEMKITPDNKHLLVWGVPKRGTDPEDISIVNLETLEVKRLTYTAHSKQYVYLMPDGATVLYAYGRTDTLMYNMLTGKTKSFVDAHSLFKFSEDARVLDVDFYPRFYPEIVNTDYFKEKDLKVLKL